MKTLQSYIKLAEATQKLMPLEPAFHYHVEFHNASMTLGPAMAKALIEAEEALRKCHKIVVKDAMQYADKIGVIPFEQSTAEIVALTKALATIQSLQENKNDR